MEDSFDAIESILRILEDASEAEDFDFREARVKFGHNVMLTPADFNRASTFLHNLDSNSIHAKTAARNIQSLASATNLPNTVNANFNTEVFVEQLNSILFASQTIGEALAKLRVAQREAEDFVNDLERALR